MEAEQNAAEQQIREEIKKEIKICISEVKSLSRVRLFATHGL